MSLQRYRGTLTLNPQAGLQHSGSSEEEEEKPSSQAEKEKEEEKEKRKKEREKRKKYGGKVQWERQSDSDYQL